MEKKIIKTFSLILRPGKVEAGPPLSTILGNVGINTVKFVKDFNDYSKNLPEYFLLVLKINIFDDKTYTYDLSQPSLSCLLRLSSFEKQMKVKGSGGYRPTKVRVISVKSLIAILVFKYGCDAEDRWNMIIGTLKSMNLLLVYDDNNIDVK